MQCPLCTIELNMLIVNGIEVDDCPKCQGIWLDRRELDRLIDRLPATPAEKSPAGWITDPPPSRVGFHGFPHARRYNPKRNKSLAHEIFDL